jgi:predicted small metal-binding protein
MKDFHCSDAGMKCDFVARGNSDEDVVKQARSHAERVHQMKMSSDMEKQVRGLIHDETSEAHKRSVAKA